MKPEEALKRLEIIFVYGIRNNWRDLEARNIAIAATEKQIPKKPQFESYGYSGGELVYDEWFCPKCGEGYEIDSHYYNYCPECGQCIDRSESDE